MATIEYEGKIYEVDGDGYLSNFDDWDETWANYVLTDIDVPIVNVSDEYKKISSVLRSFYKRNGVVPGMVLLARASGFSLKRLFELYSPSLGSLAYKMAGLSKPASN